MGHIVYSANSEGEKAKRRKGEKEVFLKTVFPFTHFPFYPFPLLPPSGANRVLSHETGVGSLSLA
jgi:hypothetical protein